MFALVRFVSAAPSGWLVDRLGERIVLAMGLGIVAVSSALAGLSTTYVQLLVLRGIGGFGSAMFAVSSMPLLLRVVSPTSVAGSGRVPRGLPARRGCRPRGRRRSA